MPRGQLVFLETLVPRRFRSRLATIRKQSGAVCPSRRFSTFLLLAPFHFLFGLPYNVAHNFLPYFSVFGLTLLVILTMRRQLRAILAERNVLLGLLVFLAIDGWHLVVQSLLRGAV